MSTDEQLQDEMSQEIVNTHYNLRGIDPQVAELQYIIEAQQLDGYGLEYFNAKVRVTSLLRHLSGSALHIRHTNSLRVIC